MLLKLQPNNLGQYDLNFLTDILNQNYKDDIFINVEIFNYNNFDSINACRKYFELCVNIISKETGNKRDEVRNHFKTKILKILINDNFNKDIWNSIGIEAKEKNSTTYLSLEGFKKFIIHFKELAKLDFGFYL